MTFPLPQNEEIVKLLLECKGINIESTNNNLATSLYIASQAGNVPIVDLLLKAGANLEARRISGATPLLIAAGFGRLELVKRCVIHDFHRRRVWMVWCKCVGEQIGVDSHV